MSGTEAPTAVSVMVFTLDEEIHIASCLESLRWTDDVIVVDSFSKDRTAALARSAGARVYEHAFEGFGKQRMWAFENADPRYEWILVLDADERVPPELAREIGERVKSAPEAIGAFRVKRRFHMWGRWLRHSNLYPTWVVRLVRRGRVTYVNKGHSETQDVRGDILELEHDLVDENLKGVDEWFERQNRYASKEAQFEVDQEKQPFAPSTLVSGDPMVRRIALKRVVARMPFRALAYFLHSYIVRGGFLEGRDGLAFCRMKAVYQQMIVAKKHALRRREET